MDKQVKYSIVVPAYNEATVIENSLNDLATVIESDKKRCRSTEVIVVVADSPDGTANLVKKAAGKFVSLRLVEPGKKVGKGRDVRAGMLAARGGFVLFTDADMATPVKHIAQTFDLLENGEDIVIGIRPLSRVHKTFMRRLRSVVSNVMIRVLAVPGIPDTQCGFKAFKGPVVKELFEPLETLAWGFDIEILVRARSLGYKIKTVKISDWYDPKIGKMSLAGESDIHANLKTLKELLQIAFKRFSGQYRVKN